jgi:hypothetical protein
MVATAIHFEHTQLRTAQFSLGASSNSLQAGEFLARALPHSLGAEADPGEKLAHVLVLSDGLSVNGSDLVRESTRGRGCDRRPGRRRRALR